MDCTLFYQELYIYVIVIAFNFIHPNMHHSRYEVNSESELFTGYRFSNKLHENNRTKFHIRREEE